MNVKRFGVRFYDIGAHPTTGQTITAYKCEDVAEQKVVLCGVAYRNDISRICREQLELMALGCGWDTAQALDITPMADA